MKKTIYVIAILSSFSIGLNQPFGFVKEKTEQSSANFNGYDSFVTLVDLVYDGHLAMADRSIYFDEVIFALDSLNHGSRFK